MTDKRDPKSVPGKAPAARGGLRLVKAEPEAAPEEAPAKPKSNLVSFMTAYADAIDRDIQALLDL